MPQEDNDLNIKGYAWIDDYSSQLLIQFARTFNLLESILNKHYQSYGLSEAKFNAIFLLYRSDDGLLLSELGNMMLVTKANMTGLIDRMEKDKLVKRCSHPTDRRSTIVKITEKGKELIEDIIPSHIALNQKFIASLSEEERNTATKLLNKIYSGMEQIDQEY